jgi:hypothetical protein
MSMSTNIIGFRAPDEDWQKKRAAYEALEAAGLDIPDELQRFFNWKSPDDSGIEVQFESTDYEYIVQPYSADMQDGYEVDLEKLRERFPQITKIRFYCSY